MIVVRDLEIKAREEADRRARRILATAIQRLSSEVVTETTVSVVQLPSDDMKGRIIGREGRNIRHLESVTGTSLIVDDTPEAVSVSSFDPVRREVARITLEKLVADGRIHPASIEEAYEKAQAEVEQSVRDAGEWALVEAGVSRMHSEIVTLMGRLKYRTSYGQNVLNHLVETAHIASMLASELGIDPAPVKRAALLHDLGKVCIPQEILNKPGRLTDEERDLVEQHPVVGARMLLANPDPMDLAAVVAYEHHIMIDGGGYPSLPGARGAQYASRLVHVCDVYDALRTRRPYREAWESERTIGYIESRAGIEFDPAIVRSFVAMMRQWDSRIAIEVA
jgi:putative nucleotidyltransferase with HDIG domain